MNSEAVQNILRYMIIKQCLLCLCFIIFCSVSFYFNPDFKIFSFLFSDLISVVTHIMFELFKRKQCHTE